MVGDTRVWVECVTVAKSGYFLENWDYRGWNEIVKSDWIILKLKLKLHANMYVSPILRKL